MTQQPINRTSGRRAPRSLALVALVLAGTGCGSGDAVGTVSSAGAESAGTGGDSLSTGGFPQAGAGTTGAAAGAPGAGGGVQSVVGASGSGETSGSAGVSG